MHSNTPGHQHSVAGSESLFQVQSMRVGIMAFNLKVERFYAQLRGVLQEKVHGMITYAFATMVVPEEEFINKCVPATVFKAVTKSQYHIACYFIRFFNEPKTPELRILYEFPQIGFRLIPVKRIMINSIEILHHGKDLHDISNSCNAITDL